MAQINAVVKFEIQRDARQQPMIVATYADGRTMAWGQITTETGARTCLKKYAKRNGFVVTGETAQAAA